MKILQTPISPNHKNAMFFEGVIATEGNSSLVTYQTGEIMFHNKYLVGQEIIEFAKTGILDDEVIEEFPVNIHVDKFFTINYNGTLLEDLVYNNYDEAIEEFTNFLNNI